MKRLVLILWALVFVHDLNAQINAAEYFFDTDPGLGNGTALSANGNEINLNISVPTSGLSDGIHKLYLRVQNNDGTWSIYDNKVFYISPNQANLADISSAEYFVDTDPGLGNGTPIALSGEIVNQNLNVPTVGLSEGVHKLYLRVTNTDGSWSLYKQNVFYIAPSQSNTANIVAAEYFLDTDPGLGNGTVLSMTGTTVDENFTVPTTTLSDGVHNLHVRILNDDGIWSLYNRKVLYVYQNNTALIAGAEYFFDIDPGFGNATAVDLDAVENLDEDLVFQVPEDLPDGDHFLYIRVLNTDGVWSLYSTSEMLSTLSVSELSEQQLKMYPNPVKDYLYLETNGTTALNLKVLNLMGQIILDISMPHQKVDVGSLSAGTYLVYLTTIKGQFSQKIIKK